MARLARVNRRLQAVNARLGRCAGAPSEGTQGRWPHRPKLPGRRSKRCGEGPFWFLATGLTGARNRQRNGPGDGMVLGAMTAVPLPAPPSRPILSPMTGATFGKRRRSGDNSDDGLLTAAAATGYETEAAPGLDIVDESLLPRWRRPSLQQVRRNDPLRAVADAPHLSVESAGVRPLESGSWTRRMSFAPRRSASSIRATRSSFSSAMASIGWSFAPTAVRAGSTA